MHMEERLPPKGAAARAKAIFGYIWAIVLNKVVEGIVVAVGGILLAYIGWSWGYLDKWTGQGNKTPDAVASTDPANESPAKPPVNTSTSIADGNLGFHRKSKYMGASSEFVLLEPGEHKEETPFSEVKTGNHSIEWAVKTVLSEGGLLGFGSTKTYMLTKGTLEGNFSRSSLVTLLKEGEEDFLLKGLLPEIRSAVQEAEAELARSKKTLTDETYVADLQENLEVKLEKALDEKLSIADIKTQILSVSILKKADLNDPKLETMSSSSMIRYVAKPPIVVAIGATGALGLVGIILVIVIFMAALFIFQIFT